MTLTHDIQALFALLAFFIKFEQYIGVENTGPRVLGAVRTEWHENTIVALSVPW